MSRCRTARPPAVAAEEGEVAVAAEGVGGLRVLGGPGRRSSSPCTHGGRGCWSDGGHGRSWRGGNGRVGAQPTAWPEARAGCWRTRSSGLSRAARRGRAGCPVRQQHERRHAAPALHSALRSSTSGSPASSRASFLFSPELVRLESFLSSPELVSFPFKFPVWKLEPFNLQPFLLSCPAFLSNSFCVLSECSECKNDCVLGTGSPPCMIQLARYPCGVLSVKDVGHTWAGLRQRPSIGSRQAHSTRWV